MAVAPPAWCSCAAAPASAETRRTSLPRRSEEHTSELQSQSNLVCRLLLEKKKHELILHARLVRALRRQRGCRLAMRWARLVSGFCVLIVGKRGIRVALLRGLAGCCLRVAS